MSKIAAFFTTVFLFLQCLFGIGGPGLGKVVLKLEENTYPVGTETIEATLYNCGFKPVGCGPYYYSLERRDANGWTPIPLKDSVVIPEAFFLIQPIQKVSKSFRLTDHENLTAGRYRISASGSAYAEFTLVDSSAVTLTLASQSYPVGTQQIKGTGYNGTAQGVYYHPYYILEKQVGGAWQRVETKEPMSFITVIYTLGPGESNERSYDLRYFDTLSAGRYRIVDYGVYAEFTME